MAIRTTQQKLSTCFYQFCIILSTFFTQRLPTTIAICLLLGSPVAMGAEPANITAAPGFWLDANDNSTITEDGSGNVSTWTSKGFLAVPFSAISGNPPLLESNIINSMPAINFNGGQLVTTIPGTVPIQNSTVFFVTRKGSNVSHFTFHGDTYSTRQHAENGDYFWMVGIGGVNGNGTATTLSPNTDYLVTFNYDGAQATVSDRVNMWINGVSEPLSDAAWPTSAPSDSTLTISRALSNSGPGSPGHLAEVLIYFSPMSEEERLSVESYLSAKYSLGLSLNAFITGNNQSTRIGSDSVRLDAAGIDLTVTLNGHTPIGGESYNLLDFSVINGNFRSVQLPTLSANLAWDTSNLYTDGTLSVINTAADTRTWSHTGSDALFSTASNWNTPLSSGDSVSLSAGVTTAFTWDSPTPLNNILMNGDDDDTLTTSADTPHTVTGSLTINRGTLATDSTLTVNSMTLADGARLQIELDDLSSYGQVIAQANLNVSGTLIITESIAEAAGQTFQILNWAGGGGSFNDVQLPLLAPGLAWDLTQLYTDGIIGIINAPGSISTTPLLWLDANDLGSTSLLETSRVSSWIDKSGHNLHARQNEALQRPFRVDANLAQFRAISFNLTISNVQRLEIADNGQLDFLGDQTIFMVTRQLNEIDEDASYLIKYDPDSPWVGWGIYYEDSPASAEGGLEYWTSRGEDDNDQGDVNFFNFTDFFAKRSLWSLSVSGTDLTMFLDTLNGGTQPLDTTPLASTANFTIGTESDGDYPFRGFMYEIIIFDTTLSESDRQAVEAYLTSKYQLDRAVWTGSALDDNASTAGNWSDNTLPQNTQHLYLNTTSDNINWDNTTASFASLHLLEDYSGTVNFSDQNVAFTDHIIVSEGTLSTDAVLTTGAYTQGFDGTLSIILDSKNEGEYGQIQNSSNGSQFVYILEGTLNVINDGLSFVEGDTFTLFPDQAQGGTIDRVGSFTTINLPTLPDALAWSTINLFVDGSITVIQNGTLYSSQPDEIVTAQANSPFSSIPFALTSSAAQHGSISYQASGLPDWASFNTSTGEISGTPSVLDIGDLADITITVTTSLASEATSPFTLRVAGANTEEPGVDSIASPLDLAALVNPTSGEITPITVSTGDDQTPPQFNTTTTAAFSSTGFFTPLHESVLANVSAGDNSTGTISPRLLNAQAGYRPGTHQLYWEATDAAGNSNAAVQTVNIYPSIAFSRTPVKIVEGTNTSITLELNGESPEYPLTADITVSGSATAGSDHTLSSGRFTINSGQTWTLPFEVLTDGIDEGNETLRLDIDVTSASGYRLGELHSAQMIITESNIAPTQTLSITQGTQTAPTLLSGGDNVVLTLSTQDQNANDTLTTEWTVPDALRALSETSTQLTLDPNQLNPGVYAVQVSTTDSGGDGSGDGSGGNSSPPLTTSHTQLLRAVDRLPIYSSSVDSDLDGVSDEEEGLADLDQDHLPDYFDRYSARYILPMSAIWSNSFHLETEPNVQLALNASGLLTDYLGAYITPEAYPLLQTELNLPAFTHNSSTTMVSFIIKGITTPGDSVKVAIPLVAPLSSDSTVQIYEGTQWVAFSGDSEHVVKTATGREGVCPAPTDYYYTSNLFSSNHHISSVTTGDRCLMITLVDGGLYDRDRSANGELPLLLAVSGASSSNFIATSDVTGTTELPRATELSQPSFSPQHSLDSQTNNSQGNSQGGAFTFFIGIMLTIMGFIRVFGHNVLSPYPSSPLKYAAPLATSQKGDARG